MGILLSLLVLYVAIIATIPSITARATAKHLKKVEEAETQAFAKALEEHVNSVLADGDEATVIMSSGETKTFKPPKDTNGSKH